MGVENEDGLHTGFKSALIVQLEKGKMAYRSTYLNLPSQTQNTYLSLVTNVYSRKYCRLSSG